MCLAYNSQLIVNSIHTLQMDELVLLRLWQWIKLREILFCLLFIDLFLFCFFVYTLFTSCLHIVYTVGGKYICSLLKRKR